MTETDESSTTQQPGRWLLTHAHLRAIVVAALGTIAGLIAARPDVLVLVVPLLLAAVWSIIAKPTGQPWATGRLARDRVAEGESNAVIVRAGDMRGGDFAAVSLAPMPWVQRRPDHGSRVAAIGGGGAEAHFTLGADPQRWGDRKIWGHPRWSSWALGCLRVGAGPPGWKTTSRNSSGRTFRLRCPRSTSSRSCRPPPGVSPRPGKRIQQHPAIPMGRPAKEH